MTANYSTNGKSHPAIRLVIDKTYMAGFFPLLQQGVTIKARVGCSVKAFLLGEIGADAETLEKIQSVFLDGRAVDDLESAIIGDGSTLALSAAMPGLVGATMRRGGRYSSFRSAITYHETGHRCSSGEGLVTLKLFNLLMAELGPGVLEKGFLVSSSDLAEFLSGRRYLLERCKQVFLNGNSASDPAKEIGTWTSQYDRVFISVEAAGEDG